VKELAMGKGIAGQGSFGFGNDKDTKESFNY
jgi:hypothetical protein